MVYVYKCKISGAEMIDDQLDIEEDYEGYVLKAKSDVIVDEDDEEGEKVNNIVHNFRYIPTKMEKKDFLLYLKRYMKEVLDIL